MNAKQHTRAAGQTATRPEFHYDDGKLASASRELEAPISETLTVSKLLVTVGEPLLSTTRTLIPGYNGVFISFDDAESLLWVIYEMHAKAGRALDEWCAAVDGARAPVETRFAA